MVGYGRVELVKIAVSEFAIFFSPITPFFVCLCFVCVSISFGFKKNQNITKLNLEELVEGNVTALEKRNENEESNKALGNECFR